MPIAKKATLENAFVKCLVWGVQGSGKSRFALSSPSPIVIDLEGSTRLYANEFDFYKAEVQTGDQKIGDAVGLTREIVRELIHGEYVDVKTIVIDPITDLLEELEKQTALKYESQIGKKVSELNALQKTKWYAFRREQARRLLDTLKNLPFNLILVARSKEIWDNGRPSGKFSPDVNPIVPYLMDVVVELKKRGHNEYEATVEKSRVANLPEVLPVKDYSSILDAIEAMKKKNIPQKKTASKQVKNDSEQLEKLFNAIEELTIEEHPAHSRNSLLKWLDVEDLRECKDIDKLRKYYAHKKKQADEQAKKEAETTPTTEELRGMMETVAKWFPEELDNFVSHADCQNWDGCQRIFDRAMKKNVEETFEGTEE